MARIQQRKSTQAQASLDLIIDTTLLAIAFTVFALIVTIRADLLNANYLLALQLVLSIPCLMAGATAEVRLAAHPEQRRVRTLSWWGFIFGYTFLINSVGILLAHITTPAIAAIFFTGNLVVALLYSYAAVSDGNTPYRERFPKDLSFVLLFIFFGLLPALGVY
jgi:hypothetical protein